MHSVNVPASELTEFDLPRVCVVTGQTQGVEFHPVKFSWYPRWVVALILVNLLVAAIVAQVLTKKVSGKLPFTPEAHAAWKKGKLLYGLSFVAFLVFIGAMIFAAANDALVVSLLCLAIAIASPVATYFRLRAQPRPGRRPHRRRADHAQAPERHRGAGDRAAPLRRRPS